MMTAVYNILEITSILFLFSYLYNKKIKLDFATVVIVSADILLMQAVEFFSLPQQWTLLLYVFLVFYCMFEYGRNIKAIVVNMLLFVIIIAILQYMIMLLYANFFKTDVIDEKGALIINIILLCIVIFGLRYCRLNKVSEYLVSKFKIIAIAVSFCVVIMVICLLSYKQLNHFDLRLTSIILLSVALICILAAYVGKYRMKSITAETELKVHKVYEESYRSLIENIRLKQHEFDNHINAIHSQHYICKTYEDLVAAQDEYCEAIESDNYFNKLLSTGNSVIVGFLYGRLLELKKQNIDVRYKVNIKSLECRVPVYKLIELLGNLMNNAEDYLKHSNQYNRMEILIIELDDSIMMEVRNESEQLGLNEIQQFFVKGYSKKGANRGLGLHNVKTICEEYNLNLECKNEIIDDKSWLVFNIKIL